MSSIRQPEIKFRFERKQLKLKLGFIPQQEIMICGLADPMFRAAEAIMRYFNGYYISKHNDELSKAEGIHIAIKKGMRLAYLCLLTTYMIGFLFQSILIAWIQI